MATVNWTAPASRTTGIAAETVAAGANFLGSEIDNEANKDRFCAINVLIDSTGAAFTVNKTLEVYILYDVTSSQYEDGGTSVDPKIAPVAVFAVPALATAIYQTAINIPLAPFAFKILIKSELDVEAAFTVLCETYNEAVA